MKHLLSVLAVLVLIGGLFAMPAGAGDVMLLMDSDLDAIYAGEDGSDVIDVDQIDVDHNNVAVASGFSKAKVEDREIEVGNESQENLEAFQNQNVSAGGDVGQTLVMHSSAEMVEVQVLEISSASETKTGVNVANVDVLSLGKGDTTIKQEIIDPVVVIPPGTYADGSLDDTDMMDIDDNNVAIAMCLSEAAVEDRGIELHGQCQQELKADQNQNVSSPGDQFCKGDVGQVEVRDSSIKEARAQVVQVLAGTQSMTGVNVANAIISTCGLSEAKITQSIVFTTVE
jgi:hypothetical protein